MRLLMVVAHLLRNAWVLADLSDEQRDRLAAQGREVALSAGNWLLREGEEAETMYVIRSGWLEAIHEGPPETVIRTMRRGEVVGELALLHSGQRTASVRARRDSVLLELSRSQFEDLIREEPSFALALARVMGAQLAVNHSPVATTSTPHTIAVVRLDPRAPGQEAVHRFAEGLGRATSVVRLDPPTDSNDADLLEMIDRAERGAERVLLVAGDTPETDTWTRLCLREAEAVLALTSGTPDPSWLARSSALHGCKLLIAGAGVSETVLTALQPHEVQVVADPTRLVPALEATARRLSGRAVGVVLSGGGARAIAHLGVLEELLHAGLQIDRLAGVSSGACVAAAVAAGWDIGELYPVIREAFLNGKPAGDYAVPAYALLRGRRARHMLSALLGEVRIEELPKRFFCVSSDLVGRQPMVHRHGSLREAVYASLAIPALLPPVATEDGRLLVDGGVLDNLPVATMASSGEGPVIASDVTSQQGPFRPTRRRRVNFIGGRLREVLTGSNATLPRLSDTILRTVTVGSIDTVAAARRHADLVIAPEVGDVALMDWKRMDALRETGRQAARSSLAEARVPWS